ncbi:MAG: hypothetical protein Mars2KO_35470 [Maribacter sp.]
MRYNCRWAGVKNKEKNYETYKTTKYPIANIAVTEHGSRRKCRVVFDTIE